MKIVLRIVKFVVGLMGVCLLVYVVFFVSFGKKTLYQHLVGISKTDEAKTLGREVGKKVEHTTQTISHTISEKVPEIVETVSEGEKKDRAEKEPSKNDQRALDQLIRSKAQPSDQDRRALQQLIEKKNKE